MPRFIQFAKSLIDLDAVSAVIWNEEKDVIELIVGGQRIELRGKARATALFTKFAESLRPLQQWDIPGIDARSAN